VRRATFSRTLLAGTGILLMLCGVVGCAALRLPFATKRVEIGENEITLFSAEGAINIRAVAPTILRISASADGEFRDEPSACVVDQADPAPKVVVEDGSPIILDTGTLRVEIDRKHMTISFYDDSGRLITREPERKGNPLLGESPTALLQLFADEHFYGLGLRGYQLDRLGGVYGLWNTSVNMGGSVGYVSRISVPFLVSTRGYGVLLDTTYASVFDVQGQAEAYSFNPTEGQFSYYFIYGPSFGDIMGRYTGLTGTAPIPPRWALGNLHLVEREEAVETVRAFRERDIPVECMLLTPSRYDAGTEGNPPDQTDILPNTGELTASLRRQGVRMILRESPLVDEDSTEFPELSSLGILGKDPEGEPMVLELEEGVRKSLIDITSPDARRWWTDKRKPLFEAGVDGWWLEQGESVLHPEGMQHHLGSREKAHNVLSLVWAQTISDAYKSLAAERRPFVVASSGYAGMQRYGAVCRLGALSPTFSALTLGIPLAQNVGLSGIPYWVAEVGGGQGKPTPELFTRWVQLATFSPIMATWAEGYRSEPWRFGRRTESICRDFMKLRYKLMPYIYSLAYEASRTGAPLVRPLVWHFPGDPVVVNLGTQYMFGPSLMVAPIRRAGAKYKEVYLPRGKWYDLWTGLTFEGPGAVEVNASVELMPVLVREDSIIPRSPAALPGQGVPLTTVALDVYPHQHASFEMYEDDGSSRAYSRGEFAITRYSADVEGSRVTITIGSPQGTFEGLHRDKSYTLRVHLPGEPFEVRVNNKVIPNGKDVKKAGTGAEVWYFDAKRSAAIVSLGASAESRQVTIQ